MIMELKEIIRDSFLILGVGNTDRGDDGIGNYVVSKLKTANKLDCGPVPENYTSKMRDISWNMSRMVLCQYRVNRLED